MTIELINRYTAVKIWNIIYQLVGSAKYNQIIN